MQVVDDGGRAGQAQVAPIVVDAFHLPFAGLGDGQALVDICRERPAGYSQPPGPAMEGVGGRSSAWPSLSCVTSAGPAFSTQQLRLPAQDPSPGPARADGGTGVPTVTPILLPPRRSICDVTVEGVINCSEWGRRPDEGEYLGLVTRSISQVDGLV